MTTVTGKFSAPGGGVPKRCAVRVELVDLAGAPVIGFTAAVEIVSAFSPTVDADGDWTVDLTPTAGIASPRGDTLWRVEETGGGQAGRFHISVPADGTHRAADLRVTLPGEPGVDLAGYLPLTGGEMSGTLVLDDGSEAASREWVLDNAGEGGGGAVSSVNGQTGAVSLDASDVGADPTGTAASEITGHEVDTDPHGDRAHVAANYLPKAYTASSQPAGPIAEWHVNYVTHPTNSPDLFRIFNNGVKKTWWNENGSIRGEASLTTEAAAKWYGLAGQTADIWQVLNNRTDAVVLACVKPTGNFVVSGNLQAANYGDGAWTVLTSNDVDYTVVDSGHAEYQPAVRLVGAAGETVQMRGRVSVTNTLLNDVPFILPSQFRPAKTIRFSLANGQSTAIHGFIDTNGAVTIGRAVTSAGWLSFDGVTFSKA